MLQVIATVHMLTQAGLRTLEAENYLWGLINILVHRQLWWMSSKFHPAYTTTTMIIWTTLACVSDSLPYILILGTGLLEAYLHSSLSSVCKWRRRCLRFSLHTTDPRRKHQILKHESSSQHCTFGDSACYKEQQHDAFKCKAAVAKQSKEIPRRTLGNCKQDDNECNPYVSAPVMGALRQVYLLISLRG